MSLRARLLAVTVTLVAVGLVVANLATFHFTRSFLEDRLDEQLFSARPFAAQALAEGEFGPPQPGITLPPGTYAEYRGPDGTVIRQRTFGYGGQAPPAVPIALPPNARGLVGTEPVTFTTPSADDAPRYRVMATTLSNGGTLLVAIPLTEVASTLRRLVRIEVLVGIVVLATAAVLALWLVRLGLKPLEGIGETAGAIAAGDLTRRVSPAEERTEVGRLGLALNSMLTQIEAAFEERRATEDRLRRFVADASHELRTPLTSIRGYAELFRRGAGSNPEDLAKSMSRIEAEAGRMGILVDDLLLLARLDQGRPLEREPVDLGAVAAEAVEAARVIEPDRPIDLELRPEVAAMSGDRDRLRHVVDNLIENARVHTASGSPIHISVVVSEDVIVLTVRDEGEGLSTEVETRVFERFFRGDPARSRDTGGAGLGLSIVAAIVKAHGGTVTARNADPDERGVKPRGDSGRGAVFEVRLPLDTHGTVLPPGPGSRGR
jgi:two-component system OmpR family sensor kinase